MYMRARVSDPTAYDTRSVMYGNYDGIVAFMS
jgi:hypothetical protein